MKLDFFLYSPWSQKWIDILIERHQQTMRQAKVFTVKRGKQLMEGRMVPQGSRAPAGGRAGDGYAPYADITANTAAGINSLFNHAEVSISVFQSQSTCLTSCVRRRP